MNTYYLAVRGLPIEVIQLKTNLTQSIIDCYIQQYGLDFIGLYESYTAAHSALLLNRVLFDNIPNDMIDTINLLERCYKLELDTNI